VPSSYAGALKVLSSTEILAPVYYIVGGSKAGQGSIVTRDRASTVNNLPLGTPAGNMHDVCLES